MKLRHLPWICALAALTACAAVKTDKTDKTDPTQLKPVAEAPKLIGRVASIPADKRFVLIQSYGSAKIETGTILTTRGADQRSANLLVTGESQGQFAAADLQSGLAEVGDAVYSRHLPAPAAPPAEPPAATEPTATQAPALPDPVLKK